LNPNFWTHPHFHDIFEVSELSRVSGQVGGRVYTIKCSYFTACPSHFENLLNSFNVRPSAWSSSYHAHGSVTSSFAPLWAKKDSGILHATRLHPSIANNMLCTEVISLVTHLPTLPTAFHNLWHTYGNIMLLMKLHNLLKNHSSTIASYYRILIPARHRRETPLHPLTDHRVPFFYHKFWLLSPWVHFQALLMSNCNSYFTLFHFYFTNPHEFLCHRYQAASFNPTASAHRDTLWYKLVQVASYIPLRGSNLEVFWNFWPIYVDSYKRNL
jgi:hypothetical protein